MLEDRLDRRALQDGHDDLQLPAVAVQAALHVDVKDALEQSSPADAAWLGLDALGPALGGCCGFARLSRLLWPLRHHPRPQLRVRRQHLMEPDQVQLGRGTSAASRCINSSGDATRCVVPCRQGVSSFNSTCPAALRCTHSSDSTGRVMSRHSCSGRLRSCASQRTAACCAVAVDVGAQGLARRRLARARHAGPGARRLHTAGTLKHRRASPVNSDTPRRPCAGR